VISLTDIITLIVALGGWVLAALVAWLNYKQKSEEIFFHALDWLSGGTQKRNLGIAAIEGYWQNRSFRELSIALLSNSAIYLLLESRQEDAEHELNNLYRMMNLLLSVKKVSDKNRFHYECLLASVKKAHDNAKRAEGLRVSKENLEKWQHQLEILLKQ